MYENLRRLQDFEVAGKTVIVRSNFDVPMKNGEIQDDIRLRASVETIEYLIERNCKIVLLAHLGNPNGEESDELSLMPIRFALGHILNKPIKFAHIHACENSIKFMEPGEIILLENIRFKSGERSEEEEARRELVKVLAEQGDIYVNDAFSAYKKHASVYDLPQMMPSVAGFSVQKEIESLNKATESAKSPYIGVIGGSKLDTKTQLLSKLVLKFDKLLLGGVMAYAFMKAEGISSGETEIDNSSVKLAKEIIKIAKSNGVEIVLPIDHVVGKEFTETTKHEVIDTQQIPSGVYGLDIGPKTMAMYREIIESAQTILWNGPMGVFEWENFNTGTEAIGEYIALSAPRDSYKVVGGIDTTYAMKLLKIKPKRFDHVSVGGEMMLKYLSGETSEILDILCGEQKI